ncbi:MAG: glycosyltransferase [Deltaproteobacteria bacterium]|nr:glycosyltransferase [Deltaproteobacteria bacterium]
MRNSSVNTLPGISVVCPTYNSADFVLDTLQTVVDQLLPPAELIVSDDGSTDDTVDKIERFLINSKGNFPTRILRNPHRGVAATRNAGIMAASEKWIAFLDSDDIWLPSKLLKVSEVIRKYPDVNFIYHTMNCIKHDGKARLFDHESKYQPNIPLINQLFKMNIFLTPAVTCKKELLINSGMFNSGYDVSEDYDLWIRLSPHIIINVIKDVLGYYNKRKDGLTCSNIEKTLLNDIRIKRLHKYMVSHSIYYCGISVAVVHYLIDKFGIRRFNTMDYLIKKSAEILRKL